MNMLKEIVPNKLSQMVVQDVDESHVTIRKKSPEKKNKKLMGMHEKETFCDRYRRPVVEIRLS